MTQGSKILLPKQETLVQSLGKEDAPEEEMATQSHTLAWKLPWTEEPGRPQSMQLQRVRHNWATEVNWTNSVKWIDFYPGIYYHATIMSIWTGEVQRYVYVNFYIVFPST